MHTDKQTLEKWNRVQFPSSWVYIMNNGRSMLTGKSFWGFCQKEECCGHQGLQSSKSHNFKMIYKAHWSMNNNRRSILFWIKVFFFYFFRSGLFAGYHDKTKLVANKNYLVLKLGCMNHAFVVGQHKSRDYWNRWIGYILNNLAAPIQTHWRKNDIVASFLLCVPRFDIGMGRKTERSQINWV